MGGGHYSQDIAYANRRGGAAWQRRDGVHGKLDPKAGPREVNNVTPIVVAMDVTRSRGDDTKLLYEQLPKLMERLENRGYVEGPGISFAAVGDANSDVAPLQVGQFEADNRLDEVLKLIWIEEGGGGTGQESYELAAWYYAATDAVRLREGVGCKGFFFFVGDEGFYPSVDGQHRVDVLGQPDEDIDSSEVFAALQQKFHVFLVYPGKSMEERKADIDQEIRRRVLAAGGQHDNVDVRVSLIWDNTNDLDLHITTPDGEHIYYGHKQSQCGGVLDVDRNVRGETRTPVENVRWIKGTAPDGDYKIAVINYAFHEGDKAPTPFRVEVEVAGELLFFEGTASPNQETGVSSRLKVGSFSFTADPEARKAAYDAYSDEVVLGQWKTVLPDGHILTLSDARLISEVLIGALAIANGKDTLSGLESHWRGQELDDAAIADLKGALKGLTAL